MVDVAVQGQDEVRSPLRRQLRTLAFTPPTSHPPSPTMTYVLPGEFVPAQHVNLKLGPGLLQVSDVKQNSTIISTRAGELKHTPNNRQWWVEGNSRRVSTMP